MKKFILFILAISVGIVLQSSTVPNQIQHKAAVHAYINATMIISSGMVIAISEDVSSKEEKRELRLSLEQTIVEMKAKAYMHFDSLYKISAVEYNKVFEDSIMLRAEAITNSYNLGDSILPIHTFLTAQQLLEHAYFVSNADNEETIQFNYVTEMSQWFMAVVEAAKENDELIKFLKN